MQQLYSEMLEAMDAAFQDFVAALPAPRLVKHGERQVYRVAAKDIEHAVVLKLALIQSTLRAALILLQQGYTLQQAMLQRVIDEASEDVWFLALAVINGARSPLHDRYLEAFWAEEFDDPERLLMSHKSRDMVSRDKIRAFIPRVAGAKDTSTPNQITKVLSKVYSGFVHGAAPHIMEMYGGAPPRFHTRGMLNTPLMDGYEKDLWNYMYRALLAHVVAAKLFGSQAHVDSLTQHKRRFEQRAGKNYG